MAGNDDLRMDHDQVKAISLQVTQLAIGVQQMQAYHTAGGLKQEHFGAHPSAAGAFQSFNGATQALAATVGKAHDFLVQVSQKLDQSAAMVKETDAESAWGITKAGGGK